MSRVYKRGNTWYIDYPCSGKRIRKAICKSKKMAKLVLNDAELKIIKRKYLGIAEPKRMAFDDLAESYIEHTKANKSARTAVSDLSIVKRLKEWFDAKTLDEITAMDVEKYKQMRKNEVSGATVNRDVACLKHMFNKAVDWGFLNENQLQCVKRFKEPPGRSRHLSEAEIKRLILCSVKHLKPIVVMALNTGMRKREILDLQWKDIDFNHRLITVKQSKNNEIKTIPINDTLYAELRSMNRGLGNQYVFVSARTGKPYTDIKHSFKTACKLAGIEDFRFHDLRHTFASRLVMAGENIRTVQELLGHKSITMTERYSHLSTAHKLNAVRKLDVCTEKRETVANVRICGR